MGNVRTAKTKKKTTPVTKKPAKKPVLKKAPAKKPLAKKTVPKKATTTAIKQNIRKISEKSGLIIPNIGIDFCGVKLNAQRHAFLVYYLTPGSPYFHNGLQAALKAGYSEETAKTGTYKMLREPDMQKIVEANKKLAYQSLHEAAKMAMEIKKKRAFFDPADYYEEKEIIVEGRNGEYTKSIMALKDLKEMSPEQRMCIDGIDVKGQASTPVYIMPDRAKELNDIIRIDAELSKSIADTGEEETREIIIERITVRETNRAKRPVELEYEIIEDPIETEEEEDDE
jgi:hypothetical protein